MKKHKFIEPMVQVITIILFFGLLSYGLTKTIRTLRFRLNNAIPVAPIQTNQWHVLYNTANDLCRLPGKGNDLCPANPALKYLWDSSFLRSDSNSLEKTLNSSPYSSIWYGVIISPNQMQKVFKAEATYLLLGRMVGRYDLWLDGRHVFSGDIKEGGEPLFVNVLHYTPNISLPLHIAIQNQNYLSTPYPDLIESHVPAGFYTHRSLQFAFERYRLMDIEIPLLVSVVAGILSLVFFGTWLASKLDPKYFYFSIFTTCHTFYSVINSEIFVTQHIWEPLHRLEFIDQALEMITAVYLGLSIVRSIRVSTTFVFFTLTIAALLLWFWPFSNGYTLLQCQESFLVYIFGPTLLLMGLLILFTEFFGPPREHFKIRLAIGLGYISMSVFYFLQLETYATTSYTPGPILAPVILEGFITLYLLLDFKGNFIAKLSGTILSEVSEQVAHDLKSPITALMNISRYASGIPDQDRSIMTMAIDRIKNISSDLLVGIRSSNQAQKDTPTSVDLVKLCLGGIEEKLNEYKSLERSQIRFFVDSSDIPYLAKANEKELHRIISNLLNNGLEAMDCKGQLEVKLSRDDGVFVIIIRDNGRGMDSSVLKSLGKRGFTTGKSEGSGLGIYHAKKNLESWGGSLEISSELSLGTTVQIRLKRVL